MRGVVTGPCQVLHSVGSFTAMMACRAGQLQALKFCGPLQSMLLARMVTPKARQDLLCMSIGCIPGTVVGPSRGAGHLPVQACVVARRNSRLGAI